ncbi:MAG: hypothetical protein AAGG38_14490 [Planctomycetota bacterium]
MKNVPHTCALLLMILMTAAFASDAFARGRMYHPELGRFMQRDPLGTALAPPTAVHRNTSASRFTQRDPVPGQQYSAGMNIYQYVNSNPIVRFDPSGLKDYALGNGPRPKINWDNGFAYDPSASPTLGDYANWYKFAALQGGATTLSHIPDATRAYAHYRGASGSDLDVNYDKAIGDDSKISTGFDNEIAGAQADIERLHDGVSEQFSVYSRSARLVNSDTENWQKALGGHRIWGYGDVTYDPSCEEYTLTITVDMEDFYNFNKGQFDIATGLPDNQNGRFEVFGWAKSFYSRGQVSRTITWERGDIPGTTEVDGEPRRRDRGRRNNGRR